MAVQLIPNQLVKLYDTETFNQRNKRLTLDYRQYCQIVREEQTTMFQVRLLPDSGNLVTNGDFVNDISGWDTLNVPPTWVWASGRLRGEMIGGDFPAIFQFITVTPGKTYSLTLTIQFGQLDGVVSVFITGGIDSSTNVSKVFTAAEYGTQPFEVTLFYEAGANVGAFVAFQITEANSRSTVFFDDVEFYELTEPTATLETCDGVLVETLEIFARANDVINYAVEWYGKPEGCYRICLQGIDDTEKNFLDRALALSTEGGAPILLEQGGYLKWFG